MYRDLRGGRADRLIDGPATIWPTYETQELTIVRHATRWGRVSGGACASRNQSALYI